MGIKSVRIQNFKSIRDSGDVTLTSLNVLIGPNGTGKSNFISFFKFLNRLYDQQLQLYIAQNGRADNLLYFGLKQSEFLAGKITFDNEWRNEYDFTMVPDNAGNLIFSREHSNYRKPDETEPNLARINPAGNLESVLKSTGAFSFRNKYLKVNFDQLRVFHFHDTGFSSKMKQPSGVRDYAFLQEDGGNLAAFLYRLQEANPANFRMIENIIQSVAPFFERFYLQPDEINGEQIYLRWQEKGSDQLFTAHNFSDGTLRMICITALLMQPDPPATIIIDEPELGLHPFAIRKLAAMLQTASDKSQIIVSTQSVTLVNEFSANDIIVVERKEHQTTFVRQSEEALGEWLSDYTLGELWEKNILGGRPL